LQEITGPLILPLARSGLSFRKLIVKGLRLEGRATEVFAIQAGQDSYRKQQNTRALFKRVSERSGDFFRV
jgi:hypothetical protein